MPKHTKYILVIHGVILCVLILFSSRLVRLGGLGLGMDLVVVCIGAGLLHIIYMTLKLFEKRKLGRMIVRIMMFLLWWIPFIPLLQFEDQDLEGWTVLRNAEERQLFSYLVIWYGLHTFMYIIVHIKEFEWKWVKERNTPIIDWGKAKLPITKQRSITMDTTQFLEPRLPLDTIGHGIVERLRQGEQVRFGVKAQHTGTGLLTWTVCLGIVVVSLALTDVIADVHIIIAGIWMILGVFHQIYLSQMGIILDSFGIREEKLFCHQSRLAWDQIKEIKMIMAIHKGWLTGNSTPKLKGILICGEEGSMPCVQIRYLINHVETIGVVVSTLTGIPITTINISDKQH